LPNIFRTIERCDAPMVFELAADAFRECPGRARLTWLVGNNGDVGGVLTSALDMTERVIEDRRRQVLRDLASRTAEARDEGEVWRVSAETLGQNRSSAPFAFLNDYFPDEDKACLASVSAETDDALHPALIDCSSESLWPFGAARSGEYLVVDLGKQASAGSFLAGQFLQKRQWSSLSGCATIAR
jgi:hypothetical protein